MVSEVWFDSNMMHVRLLYGREISAPLEWFPKLRNATAEQRKKWKLIGKGVGIHWKDIDAVAAILYLYLHYHSRLDRESSEVTLKIKIPISHFQIFSLPGFL
jgi:hypothetical protein